MASLSSWLFGCDHTWFKFHEVTIDSYVEALKAHDYEPKGRNDGTVSVGAESFNKASILIMVCEHCGKIKRIKEESKYGE